MFRFNIIEKIENIKIYFGLGKIEKDKGNGGDIFIAARNMTGTGEINADGGEENGKAGNITIITDNNSFAGKISAKGRS